jgi:hypothetical protein
MLQISTGPHIRKGATLLEVSSSVYFSLLIITANGAISAQHLARDSWVDRLQSMITPSHYAWSYQFAFGILWAGAAVLVFTLLRLSARLSSDFILRTGGGIVSVLGFPLIFGYVSFRGFLHMLRSPSQALLYAYSPHRWLLAEVIVSIVCVLIYASLSLPSKRFSTVALLLLLLHFAFWSWFALTDGASLLIYVLLGLLASLVWSRYVSRVEGKTSALHTVSQQSGSVART